MATERKLGWTSVQTSLKIRIAKKIGNALIRIKIQRS